MQAVVAWQRAPVATGGTTPPQNAYNSGKPRHASACCTSKKEPPRNEIEP